MTIQKDGMTVTDKKDSLVETENGITCGCGNPKLSMTMHIDGTDFYTWEYICSCGNYISVCRERRE